MPNFFNMVIHIFLLDIMPILLRKNYNLYGWPFDRWLVIIKRNYYKERYKLVFIDSFY